MRKWNSQSNANMFLVMPIVLVTVFMAVDFMVYGDDFHPDTSINADKFLDETSIVDNETDHSDKGLVGGFVDWLIGNVPVVGDVIEIGQIVFGMVMNFLEILWKFIILDINILNVCGDFQWFVKTPIWISELIGFILILPFT